MLGPTAHTYPIDGENRPELGSAHEYTNLGDAPYGKTAEESLHSLLVRAFDGDELRRFVELGPLRDAVAPNLPERTASVAQIAQTLIITAIRHGSLDATFFPRLEAERPTFRHEIRHIEQMFSRRGARASQAEAPREGRRPRFTLRVGWRELYLEIVFGCAFFAVGGYFLASKKMREPMVIVQSVEPEEMKYPTPIPWVPPPVSICEDPLLRDLRDICAGGCSSSDLQRLATVDLDRIVSNVPGAFTVHFPSGYPSIGGARPKWPTGSTESFYVEQIRRKMKDFRNAESILLIGRSSLGGNVVRNKLYAMQRIELVREFIVRSGDNAMQGGIKKKFIDLVLGNERIIDRRNFAEHYPNDIVAWDLKSGVHVSRLSGSDEISVVDEAWLTQVINQSVVVVPIPCGPNEKLQRNSVP